MRPCVGTCAPQMVVVVAATLLGLHWGTLLNESRTR
jgi:hypothetical protein